VVEIETARSAPRSWSGHAHARLALLDLRPVFATGLVGSVVVAVGSFATGRLAPTSEVGPLVALRHEAWVGTSGRVLLFVGLLTMTLGWALLGRLVRHRECSSRRVTLTALGWAAPLMVAPPAFSGDVWAYVANGMLAARGLSPYVATPSRLSGPVVAAVSAKWRSSPSPYGPLATLWGDGTARLTSSVWLDLLSFRLLALAGFALLALALVRLARLTGRDPATALWLVLASPFTLVHGLDEAHLDLLLAGLTTMAVVLALKRRSTAAVLLLGCAAAIKVPALLAAVPVALAVVLVAGRTARWVRLCAAAAVGLGALATVFGLGWISGVGNGWLAGLRTPLTVLSPLSPSTQLGLLIRHVTGGFDVALARTAGSVLIVVCAAWGLLSSPRLSPTGVAMAGAFTAAAGVLLSPVVHFWYFFWCLPLLASIPLGRGARRALVAVTAACGLLAPLDASQHLPDSRTWQLLGLGLALSAGLDHHRVRDALRRVAHPQAHTPHRRNPWEPS